jgi:anti-sigma regulatory factor (Ser/Thr protein kinase)
MIQEPPPLALPFSLSAPKLARQHLRNWAAHLPDTAMDDALLLTSELVANAVRHGAPDIALQVSFDPPHITVAVIDGGHETPVIPTRPIPASSLNGRGLHLVDTVATRWGVSREHADRTCVWFQLER